MARLLPESFEGYRCQQQRGRLPLSGRRLHFMTNPNTSSHADGFRYLLRGE